MAKKADDSDEDSLFQRAKRRIKIAQEVEAQQRKRELEDLQFQVPELQWDESAKKQRQGGNMLPARPCLSISMLDQPIQIVENQERSSKLGVNIEPLSPDADPEVATILEGIYRRIERDSRAHIARSWAFGRAVRAGRGFYRILTKYAEEYGDESEAASMDQVICIERILDQSLVYLDPSAQQPDYSDGEWGAILSWVPVATFKRQFPKAEKDGTDQFDFAQMLGQEPEWVRGSHDRDGAVLVAEYYEKKHDEQTVKVGGSERKRDKITLLYAKLSGFELLEEQDQDGQYIPIVPVIGRELQPFDDERRYQGIVGPAKDSQRGYNYAISQAIETASLEPKAPYLVAEGQIEGFEDWWKNSNTRNYAYLPYKPRVNGVDIGPPQRSQVDVNRLGLSLQLAQMFNQGVQTTTATYDPSLGRTSSREKSGRAILALQEQGDQTNSHYMSNLADISMQYEARVVLDLVPYIYDRPGRIARTLDDEGRADVVMLNQDFYKDDKGQPRPAPAPQPEARPGMPPGPPGMPQGGPQLGMPGQMPAPMPPKPPTKRYDLKKGIYSVAISIGKQRQTAMQEAADEIGQILQAQPNLMPVIGPIYFKNRNWPGAKELADLLLKVRDQQMPFLAKDEKDQQKSPEQLQAENQDLKMKLQEAGQVIQQAQMAMKTDQAKQQATMAKAQVDAQTTLAKAQMDNQAKLQAEQIKAEGAINLKAIAAQLEQVLEALKLGHQSDENAKDRAADVAKEVVKGAMAPVDLAYSGSAELALPTTEEV